MLEKLEQQNLQTITLAKSTVRWYEKDKEIIIGHSLFDVKSKVIKGDSIVFIGLFDEEETLLKMQAAKLVERRSAQSGTNHDGITQLVFQIWYLIDDDHELFGPFTLLPHKVYWYNAKLIQADTSTLSPPPKTLQDIF
jgi:hypothetical protein